MKTPSNQLPESKQVGMVAIMVTLILMIVISLLVIGFAQISRRNSRQALDRQLSTQAFYAAESGVNDAAQLIKTAVSGGGSVADKPDCSSNGGGFYATLNPVLDASQKVQYTCLLVDATPNSLSYTDVGTTSTVIPVIATSGTISSINLTWQSKDDSANVNSCPSSKTSVFAPTGSSWTCSYGVLRFDLVPTAGSALTTAGLQSSTMTTFVVPLKPGSAGADTSSFAYASDGSKDLLGIICSATNCSATINSGLGQSQYYLRVSSVYKDVSLQVTASNGASAVSLRGAQAVIDATGKAQDVLRRIQVRIPLVNSSTNLQSDYALQSTEAICKRFSVMNGYFSSDAATALSNAGFPGLAASTTNPFCQ